MDGNRYIDFMCAYGPNVLGYNDPEVDAAALEQLKKRQLHHRAFIQNGGVRRAAGRYGGKRRLGVFYEKRNRRHHILVMLRARLYPQKKGSISSRATTTATTRGL